jgi:AraC family transcriptional regulator
MRTPARPSPGGRRWGNVRVTPAFVSSTVAFGPYRCTARAAGATAEHVAPCPVIVMPHAVPFVLWHGRQRTVVDPNSYLFLNGSQPYRASHPFGCGDEGSFVFLERTTLVETLGAIDPSVESRPDRPFPAAWAPSRPAACLAARLLFRLARLTPALDTLALEELTLDLARGAFASAMGAAGARPSAAPQPARTRDLSEATKELLVGRLREPLSLGAIAAELDVSASYLERAFRRETGLPIFRYRRRLRLRASLLAVLEGGADLAAIALDFGFSSHSHFTAAFGREFGVTPLALRRAGSTSALPVAPPRDRPARGRPELLG